MIAVILAGGRGARFGKLTSNIPKPLIQVAGKELIYHVFDALPEAISKCIVVVGYLGNRIKDSVGENYKDLPILYSEQITKGTGGALLSAKKLLSQKELFLVIGSDDIFGKNELSKLIIDFPTYGICYKRPNKPMTHEVKFDKDNFLIGFSRVDNPFKERFFGVGSYVLSYDFFSQKIHKMSNGELSIPHTLAFSSFPVKVAEIRDWMPVNSLKEKIIAEEALRKE